MPKTIDDVDEHPIIFNEWSIQRILAGEKTQARRIVKPQPPTAASGGYYKVGDDAVPFCYFRGESAAIVGEAECPYGQPGSRLWAREAFRLAKRLNETSPKEAAIKDGMVEPPAPQVRYEADGCIITEADEWGRKRPSIHMPKELCRLRLRVEDVRVERVQEITTTDAVAEGISPDPFARYAEKGNEVNAFRRKWSDIHGDGAWERNDWVWVVEFSQIDNA